MAKKRDNYDLGDSSTLSELADQIEQITAAPKGERVEIEKVRRPQSKRSPALTIVISAVVLVAFAAGVWYVWRIANERRNAPGQVAIPDVIGKPLSTARAALNAAGLRPSVEGAAEDARVTGMIPAPGSRVAMGATVKLYTTGGTTPAPAPAPTTPTPPGVTAPTPGRTGGGGPPPATQKVKVPSVVGANSEEAQRTLTQVGLVPEVIAARAVTVPDRVVISTDPAPGVEVAPATRIRIFVNYLEPVAAPVDTPVAVQPITVRLKDYTGKPEAEVKSDLTALGLVPSVTQENTRLQKPGFVLRTMPAAGTEVAPKATVTVVVAR